MMKTGEMKWNGGSQNTVEKAAKLGKFFVALFQKTRANGKNEDEEAERNGSHSHVTSAKFWDFLAPSTHAHATCQYDCLLFSLTPSLKVWTSFVNVPQIGQAGGAHVQDITSMKKHLEREGGREKKQTDLDQERHSVGRPQAAVN